MRESHHLAVGALLALGLVAAGSAVAAADHETEVTVDGTVTGVDGAPAGGAVVFLGEDSTLTQFSPATLREFATAPPQNLTVAEVGDDGRFETALGSRRAEAAVAVSDAGVSDLVYVGGENATLSLQLHERRPQTVHAHLGAVSHDERRADLLVNLVNSGDDRIENLSVRVEGLPDGWGVADVTTAGEYRRDEQTLTWASVAPGAEVDTTVALAVPADAAVGEYTVALRAESDTHRVDVDAATAEVLPEETPGPTTTPPPSGDGEGSETEPTATPTGTPPETTAESAPGFSAGLAALALLLAGLLGREHS